MNLLSVKNLSYMRDNRFLFKNLNFELKNTDLLHICGSNGVGKSTLLQILIGLISPMIGYVKWNIEDVRSLIQYIGHTNGLKNQLTVIENVKLIATIAGVNVNPKLLLEKAQMIHLSSKKVIELSAGQKRRLALSRLIISPAKIWILDEPTTALDTQGKQWLKELFIEHLSQDGGIISTTHEKVSGRVLVLDDFIC